MERAGICKQFALVLGLTVAGCGTPSASTAKAPVGSAPATAPAARAGRGLIDLYRQAGFVSSRGREFVETWAATQDGTRYGWRGADELVPAEPGAWMPDCRAFERAPKALRPSDEGQLNDACRMLEPTFRAADFERSLRHLLSEHARLRSCPGGRTTVADVTAAWDRPPVGTNLARQSAQPSALGWVAYASWADELGLDGMSEAALDAAEQELGRACTHPPCTADELLRSEAQRALVGEALTGLAADWLGREAALELARRAVAVAPSSHHPIAEQSRALEQRLREDLEHDQERRAAGERFTKDLAPARAVPVLLAQLPDTLGIGFEAPDRGCDSPNPAVKLADIGRDAVPGLLALLEDQRLTRSVALGGSRRIPLHTVGEAALAALEQIAQRDFGEGEPASAVAAAWWAEAQNKSDADLAADAFRSAEGPMRLRLARALGERDLHRLVVELPAAIRSSDAPHLRAALVRLFEAPNLVQLAASDRCADYPRSERVPTPEQLLSPEYGLWQRLERHAGKTVELPPEVRRVVFRTLLLTLGDQDPAVRLAAAQALLTWGRKEGLARAIRDAGDLTSHDPQDLGKADRVRQTIELLLASGTDTGIAVALRLVNAERTETVDAASYGLATGILRARAAGRRFSIPEPHRTALADVATEVLASELRREGIDYAVGGTTAPGAQWLLELLRGGSDYQPLVHVTPVSRLERAYALVNAERSRRGEPALPTPLTELPKDPSARSWTEQWRSRPVDPAALLESFRGFAQAHPGRQSRLRLIREPSGTVVHLTSGEVAAAAARVSVLCYGAPSCPWLLHGQLSAEAIQRRLDWVSERLASVWPASGQRTLDVTIMLSLPAQEPACPKP